MATRQVRLRLLQPPAEPAPHNDDFYRRRRNPPRELMTRFLIRRVIFAVLLVFVSSSAALFLTRLAPGDLASSLGPNATRAEIAAARARFDLDRPMLEQWRLWVTRAAKLDFGDSLLYSRPVGPLVTRAATNSAALGVTALLVATVL